MFGLNCFAQAPSIDWQRSIGESDNDYTRDIKQTPDGGYILVGSTTSNTGIFSQNHGNLDILVMKVDQNGVLEWQKLYGGSGSERARNVFLTSDGGYVLSGTTNSNDFDVENNHGGNDYFVLKLNSFGEIDWKKCIGGSANDYLDSVIQTSDGGYALAGISFSLDGDNTVGSYYGGCWLVKLDAIGNILWQRRFDSAGYSSVDRTIVKETSDHSLLVSYSEFSPLVTVINETSSAHFLDIFVKRIDATGTILFENHYGGPFQENTTGEILPTDDLGFIIIGTTMLENLGDTKVWVMKADSLGNIEWQTALGGSNRDYGISIKNTEDGGYIILGNTNSNDGDVNGNHGVDTTDFWIVKINSTGTILWQKCFGGSDDETASAIDVTDDNGYIVTGNSISNDGDVTVNNGNSDVWLFKLSPDALTNPSFDEDQLLLFPNPVNTILNIKTLNNSLIDKINIIDTTGKTVVEQNSNLNQINVENLAKGIYLIEVFSDNVKYQTKFIKE